MYEWEWCGWHADGSSTLSRIGSIIIHAQTLVARDTTDAPQIVEHIKKSLTFTPFCTRWIPCSAKFVVLGQNPRATGAMQVIAR